ncbi:MAG: glutamate--tRNA ligase [Gammaproteobacteria bacterium]|nr:glutamate--tRNA ligase [Gammaproteobacteria bacterium]
MKTRFCPSPTGHMHLGNLRTALFAALFARSQNGQFLLRIEDTDLDRSMPEFTEALLEDLKWLGLFWDEGPGKDLGNGPYYQSERQSIYDRFYEKIIASGHAYYCFCSEKELALNRKLQLSRGQPPRYSGRCHELTQKEIQEKLEGGLKPTLRFRVPQDQVIEYVDFVKGEQRFNSNDLGDFIIRRADGTSPFMFCNAIDDSLMGVTHVMRGEDHVSNTPRQMMILKALGLRVPEYGHISLIRSATGAKLSKREGSDTVRDMREIGFLPGAIINCFARLGHHYESNDYMDFDELAKNFKIAHLSKSPAAFDQSQLVHWQKMAVTHLSEPACLAWLGDELQSIVPPDKQALFIKTIQPNILFLEDAYQFADVFFKPLTLFDHEKIKILQQAGSDYFEQAIHAVETAHADYEQTIHQLKILTTLKGKALFMPLRIALTGETHGPELANVFLLLGQEVIKERLAYAKKALVSRWVSEKEDNL